MISHPIRLGLPVGVGLSAVAAPLLVSLWAEHHAALAADRQRALPKVKAAAMETPLPRLRGRQLGHQKLFPPGGFRHLNT